MAEAERTEIRPQPGPQTAFLASPADIAIYGGAAGGGKTWALLMEPLRHVGVAGFGAVCFRRTTVQVRNEGGLWDESEKLYPLIGGTPRAHMLDWRFPAGPTLSFAHLEHEKTVSDWQGSQIPLIMFDELCHFTAKQFWYLVSRNRSMCGVKPYIRATCNPDPDSWVAEFIAWWIDQDTGYAIPERSGVIRWFVRINDQFIWADQPEELSAYTMLDDEGVAIPIPPKSVTFIAAKLSDNKALMRANPEYLANLMALPPVERERLLGGNWKIKWGDDAFFNIANFLVDGQPVPFPPHCDGVFAVLDTSSKTGKQHDGTSVTYFARSKHSGHPLTILDWDLVQIEGSLLDRWLPSVFARLEELAQLCRARTGAQAGVLIEDKDSGVILLQNSLRNNLNARPIDSRLTALGKDERCLAASPYVNNGMVKITEHAYHKVVTFKDVTKNHLIAQVTNFRPADPDAHKRADDALDTVVYGVNLALGNSVGV